MLWALLAAYALVALVVGAFVAAAFSLACEGRGFCADLDRTGGYGFLIAGPPLAVVVLGLLAHARRSTRLLHVGFVVVLVMTLAVFAVGASVDA